MEERPWCAAQASLLEGWNFIRPETCRCALPRLLQSGLGTRANLPHYRLQGDEAPLLIHHQNGKIMLINAYGNFHTT